MQKKLTVDALNPINDETGIPIVLPNTNGEAHFDYLILPISVPLHQER